MKDINFYMNLDYPYVITPDEGGYQAEIPLLPGCIAHGATEEDGTPYPDSAAAVPRGSCFP